jgi:hypothetical protein
VKIFWIVFAFIFLAIGIGGFIVALRELTPEGFIPTIVTLPALVALFAYAFRKKIWRSGVYFWRTYPFVFIAFCIYQDWNLLSKSKGFALEDWIEFGISWIILVFCFTGVYLYAFRFLKVTTESLTTSGE